VVPNFPDKEHKFEFGRRPCDRSLKIIDKSGA